MNNKCCSGDGEGRKDKGGGGGSRSKTSCIWRVVCDKVVCERWCVTKTNSVCDKVVCVWKMVCDKVVCARVRERWCVWKLCVQESVWQSCVWKMVCDKVVWWCVTKLCVKDGVVKDGVWQGCVWKMVCDKVGVWQSCVWKMVCDKVVGGKVVCESYMSKIVGDKVVCERWCVKDGVWQRCVREGVWQRWCVQDGAWQSSAWKMVCQRWCVKDGVWQSGVWKMACDKDGVWKMACGKVVWKMVCQRWCVTKWCVKDGGWRRWWVSGADGSGIQNQKQEPHTKMWGKNNLRSYVSCGVLQRPRNGCEKNDDGSGDWDFCFQSWIHFALSIWSSWWSCAQLYTRLTALDRLDLFSGSWTLSTFSRAIFRMFLCSLTAMFPKCRRLRSQLRRGSILPSRSRGRDTTRTPRGTAASKPQPLRNAMAPTAAERVEQKLQEAQKEMAVALEDFRLYHARDKYTDFIMTKFIQTRHCWVLHHGHFGCDTWGMMDSNQLPATSYCTYDT